VSGPPTSQPHAGAAKGAREELRRLDHRAIASLEPFVDSPLLETGQINLLSLDAVIARLGPRWRAKRQAVYDYTERTLDRALADQGHYFRVSDSDFLVVLPYDKRSAAQVRCLRYLRAVLIHFLGEARPADIAVREVTRIANTALEAVRVDLTKVAAAESAEEVGRPAPVESPPADAPHRECGAGEAPTSSAAPASDGWAPSASVPTADRWTPFIASDGNRVRVSCVLEPVFELRGYGRIGNRIARRVVRTATDEVLGPLELQRLSRGDIERIDLATIARGLGRLRAEQHGDRQLSLIIPVSYISLSHRAGRAALAELLHEARELVQTGVIVEVCDIEGAPQAALLEATSLIRPYCMFLIGRLNDTPDRGVGNLQNAGLSGVSFDAPQVFSGDAEFLGWTKSAVRAAKRIAKSVIIYRLASARQAGMAALLGVSHASLRPGAEGAAAVA
jgi:hypothetical protein